MYKTCTVAARTQINQRTSSDGPINQFVLSTRCTSRVRGVHATLQIRPRRSINRQAIAFYRARSTYVMYIHIQLSSANARTRQKTASLVASILAAFLVPRYGCRLRNASLYMSHGITCIDHRCVYAMREYIVSACSAPVRRKQLLIVL